MKIFFSICAALIVVGFLIGSVLLILLLPFIVDSNTVDDYQESIDSSDQSQTNEENSSIDFDDISLSRDDDNNNSNEQDVDEVASF